MNIIKDTIVNMFELDKLSPEKAAEMTERLAKIIFQSVLVRVLPLLSEEDLGQYEKIVDSQEGGEAIFAFLGEKIPDFENIIAEEAESLKEEMMGEMNSAGL